MNSFLPILGLIILAVIIIGAYRMIMIKRQHRKLNDLRFDRVKPLYDQLNTGAELTKEEVKPFAENLLARETTYQLLSEHQKLSLFPRELITIEKAAESNLANWLEFPTELDACPDEIEHIKRVGIDFDGKSHMVFYEVFKYKTHEPHWAAKDGWILGVVGPYFEDSKPYDFPQATFSRVSSTLENTSPDEEAKWVHEHISRRR